MNRRDRPRVIANFALTADGKTSTRNFTPTGFTSKFDLQRLLEIRSLGDAVLVGRGTLAADNMSLGLPKRALQAQRRARGQAAQPLRAVISRSGKFDLAAKFFQTAGAPRILFTERPPAPHLRGELNNLATVHQVDSLSAALTILRRDYNVRTLACEGGPSLFRDLIVIDAIDDLYITRAPLIFGGAEAPTLTGLPGDFVERVARARLVSLVTRHHEAYLHYTFPTPHRAA